MSDDLVDPNQSAEPTEAELSRKDRNAARRAEFEAMKAAKDAEKAAAKETQAQERAAAKEAKEELIAQAKAAKEAAKAAKKESKSAEKPHKEPKTKKEKPAKPEKDPYRPRFATAPTKVRAFAIIATLFAVVYAAGALLLLLETTSSPVLGELPADASALAYVGAAAALAIAVLWTVSAVLLCAGRVLGKHLGVVALILGLPLSIVAAPMLFSSDVRDWAL